MRDIGMPVGVGDGGEQAVVGVLHGPRGAGWVGDPGKVFVAVYRQRGTPTLWLSFEILGVPGFVRASFPWLSFSRAFFLPSFSGFSPP